MKNDLFLPVHLDALQLKNRIVMAPMTRNRAEADLEAGRANLVAFGRPFISNPDLDERLRTNTPLADPNAATFYTPGVEGYTDYPAMTG